MVLSCSTLKAKLNNELLDKFMYIYVQNLPVLCQLHKCENTEYSIELKLISSPKFTIILWLHEANYILVC